MINSNDPEAHKGYMIMTLAEDFMVFDLAENAQPNLSLYCLPGVILVDLALHKYIRIDDNNPDHLTITGVDAPADAFLSEALAHIQQTAPPLMRSHWLQYGTLNDFPARLVNRLIQQGTIQQGETSGGFLGRGRKMVYITDQSQAGQSLLKRVRDTIEGNVKPEPHTVMLLVLLDMANVSGILSGKETKAMRNYCKVVNQSFPSLASKKKKHGETNPAIDSLSSLTINTIDALLVSLMDSMFSGHAPYTN